MPSQPVASQWREWEISAGISAETLLAGATYKAGGQRRQVRSLSNAGQWPFLHLPRLH
jgi:hypothetical protein